MLSFNEVSKSYPGPDGTVEVLRRQSFHLRPGDLAVVRGPSGCGKSTLLFTAGGMLPPDAGTVNFEDKSLYDLPLSRRNSLRGTSVGFIFQRFHLIPYLDVGSNIRWPLRWNDDPARLGKRIPELTRRLGIQHRLSHYPWQLSAGEQQRVAAARALAGEKKLICADEPTGNLDEENAAIVLEALKKETERGCIILFATHQSHLFEIGNAHISLTND